MVEGIGASAAQHTAAHEEHEDALSAGGSAIDASSTACIGQGTPSPPACDICIGIIAQPKPETANTVRIGKANSSSKTIKRFIGAD